MSFIDFESGWEKEKARQELREVRAELLKRVSNKKIKFLQNDSKNAENVYQHIFHSILGRKKCQAT